MKLRVLDRILVAVAGLIILSLCAAIVAQVFFDTNVIDSISDILDKNSTLAKIAFAAGAAALLVLGVYCLLVLFRHRKRKDRFIMQKMESGDLAISLKTLESMIAKCLDQHKEIQVQSVRTENQRDGLVVTIHGTVAGGISIPLTVDTLQKQIKQYVTACSGIEVKGIKVLIESSGEEVPDAMFAIDAPVATPLLREAEENMETAESTQETDQTNAGAQEEMPAAAAVPAEKTAAEAALEAVENLKKEYTDTEEDDRPIHQRLFSTPAEPCIMPLPPENLTESSGPEKDKETVKPEKTKEPVEPEKPKEAETPAETVRPEEPREAATAPEKQIPDQENSDNA